MENSKELKLDYPLVWEYKIILEKEHDAKLVGKEVLEDREHSIKKSQDSKKGKYISHTLKVTVHSDEDRKAIFQALKEHLKIKFVL
ncbi:MAG: DUF493 domain-containing protein [Sulfurospirillaceae bacterium]|nr:DUF493 domain-containing protein [Sulfurospirillaceae bacterium]